ncbi:hypothetical protein SAMN05446589_5265 [Streptomyces sp. OV198]|uniref:hypothetical protein n=1 Tax=Streptomyces sp. OV198 TaxID=1882787 RepID=UPI000BC4E188|nr:hypothetical protein [Streptomyces sp. OV198]SOE74426.1 hypothetical protein SAMN05446589_5265 [Streptomyces sp. OV198]
MTHPDTHLALHHQRAAELRAQAETHHLTASARRPGELRTRLGWTIVEVGLRLAAAPRVAVAH